MSGPGLDLLTMAPAVSAPGLGEDCTHPQGLPRVSLASRKPFLDAEPESRDGLLLHSSFGNPNLESPSSRDVFDKMCRRTAQFPAHPSPSQQQPPAEPPEALQTR
ncbi:hypothetical protein P7K49_011962, partial [Saguinus oedipus]